MILDAIIFDWDGTIVDIEKREMHSVNKGLSIVGSPTISMQQFIEGCYSRPYKELGSRNLIRKILCDEQAAKKAIEVFVSEFRKTIDLTRLQEGALDVLTALRNERLSLAVATLRRRHRTVEQEMQYLKIDGFFDVLVTREDIGFPDHKRLVLENIAGVRAHTFTKALSLLGTKPWNTMIVGDSWWDIRAAKQVEATAVWVKTGFGAYNDFSKEEPDVAIDTLSDLPKQMATL